MSITPVITTDFPGLPLHYRGKVRDVYDLGEFFLMVTTDRISAFDVVMPTPIPDKGSILNQMSAFWFKKFESLIGNHMVSTNVGDYPTICKQYARELAGRSMLVKKTTPLPAEAIVRGYLVGSGWKDYQKTGCVCGISLPPGLREAEKLKTTLFTPSTKAEGGDHDENISFTTLADLIGRNLAERIRDLSVELYNKASSFTSMLGILLADTKLEWGEDDEGNLLLIDEAFTPDSSRFWPADQYQIGCSPPSFDKQYLRDWLVNSGWNASMPPPELPQDVVDNTRKRYLEALEILTGRTLD